MGNTITAFKGYTAAQEAQITRMAQHYVRELSNRQGLFMSLELRAVGTPSLLVPPPMGPSVAAAPSTSPTPQRPTSPTETETEEEEEWDQAAGWEIPVAELSD